MDKKDSTGVCFIGERNFKEFLSNYLPSQKGDIIDGGTMQKVGTHQGVLYYTLGQRKGLGIGGIKGVNADGGYFVYKKDVTHNILYVAKTDRLDLLESDKAILTDINFIPPRFEGKKEVGVKFRYRQPDQMAYMHFEGDTIVLEYEDHPVKAVTPGQIAALYEGEKLLGGGILDAIYRRGKKLND